MAVRNFYVRGTADGGKWPNTTHDMAFGPNTGKGSGFSLTLTQRHNGAIVPVLEITGLATQDGRLVLDVSATSEGAALLQTPNSQPSFVIESKR